MFRLNGFCKNIYPKCIYLPNISPVLQKEKTEGVDSVKSTNCKTAEIFMRTIKNAAQYLYTGVKNFLFYIYTSIGNFLYPYYKKIMDIVTRSIQRVCDYTSSVMDYTHNILQDPGIKIVEESNRQAESASVDLFYKLEKLEKGIEKMDAFIASNNELQTLWTKLWEKDSHLRTEPKPRSSAGKDLDDPHSKLCILYQRQVYLESIIYQRKNLVNRYPEIKPYFEKELAGSNAISILS